MGIKIDSRKGIIDSGWVKSSIQPFSIRLSQRYSNLRALRLQLSPRNAAPPTAKNNKILHRGRWKLFDRALIALFHKRKAVGIGSSVE